MIRLAASPSGGLPRRRPASARAFTLIEILVALAILSSGLLAIYRLQASAVQLAVRARDTMAAADFAASLIRAWELDPPGIGSRQGEAVFQGAEMKWQADFSKAPFSGLLRVDLNIQLAGQRPGSLFSGSFLAPENGSLALGAEWAH